MPLQQAKLHSTDSVFRLCDPTAYLMSKYWGKILSTSAFCLFFVTSSLCSWPLFSLSFPYLSLCLQKPLHTPRYFQLQFKSDFCNSIPASSGKVTIILLCSFCFCLLHSSFWCLSSVRGSLCTHAGLFDTCSTFCTLEWIIVVLSNSCPWRSINSPGLLCPSRKFSVGSRQADPSIQRKLLSKSPRL